MGVYDIALKLEADSEKFYLDQVDKAENGGLKRIFKKLADDERKHIEYVKQLEHEDWEFVDTDVLEDVKNVFTELLEENITFKVKLDTIEAYEFACAMEKTSIEYYGKMSEEAVNANTKKILIKLMNEEKKHLLTLENIILYLRQPESWVEHAEFTIRQDY
ncbi:MAG: ferritin family protein [Eubacteriaceae bacterium]|nr:ferritin family protein [Eubacteriaceae bacterium]